LGKLDWLDAIEVDDLIAIGCHSLNDRPANAATCARDQYFSGIHTCLV
jgi:hypothetical protein